MRLVVALGGNALLKRGQPLTPENQLENIRIAATQLARVADGNQLVVTHGNGPQVGLLALQAAAYDAADAFPLDVLGAQTDGMIGYLLEQELANRLPAARTVATLLTRVEVDPQDPAFHHPSKPIGPIYTEQQAAGIAQTRHWTVGRDGSSMRRLVASPQPKRVLGLDSIRLLLEHGALVVAAGGGGIPVARGIDGRSLQGVDAVVDKDLCSGLLAVDVDACARSACPHHLLQIGALAAQMRQPIDDVLHQMEAVQIVLHAHVEGGGDRAFLLVAAHMQVAVGPAIGQPVDQRGIAVEAEDDVLVLGEQRIVVGFAQPVRMLARRAAASSDRRR
jgi:carbamate kinase